MSLLKVLMLATEDNNEMFYTSSTALHQIYLVNIGAIFLQYRVCYPKIAILDFELNDITSLPNTPKELIRTASIKPFFEAALKQKGDYQFIQISQTDHQAANPGLGYLFKFQDIAAKLGRQSEADWIIVSQHSKPSFLFSYLMVHVVNVKTGKLIGRYEIELKGNHAKVTQRGVKNLANKISTLISKYKTKYP